MPIYGVGIDMEETARVERLLKNERFLRRVYGDGELSMLLSRGMNPAAATANFCAKEAFAKAVGLGFRGFSLQEVEALRDPAGKPYYKFGGRALELAERLGVTAHLSITHTKLYAAAYCVLENIDASPCE